MYSTLHNADEDMNLGDITKVDEDKIDDFNLMTYGFPCQDLSALGNNRGFFNPDGSTTRSGLLFDALRIAKHKKPNILVAENVKGLINKNNIHNFNIMLDTLSSIGYKSYYKVMNAKDYGLPHSRQRVFIVSIRDDLDDGNYTFPKKKELDKYAHDFYDDKKHLTEDLYLNEHQIMTYAKNPMRLKKKYSSLNSDVIICQTTKQGQKSNPQNFVEDNKGVRILTGNEMLRLQGFRDGCGHKLIKSGFTTSQIGFASGNSLSVAIMKLIILSVQKYI